MLRGGESNAEDYIACLLIKICDSVSDHETFEINLWETSCSELLAPLIHSGCINWDISPLEEVERVSA